jgi:methionine-rich copper-binding protein CopC
MSSPSTLMPPEWEWAPTSWTSPSQGGKRRRLLPERNVVRDLPKPRLPRPPLSTPALPTPPLPTPPLPTSWRWGLRLLLAAVMSPSVAQAHAILEESTPPAGTALKPGPLDLHLRYNSRIDRARSRLTLIRPDRTKDTVPIDAEGAPDIIAAHLDLPTASPPGLYVIRWQVLAVDGHITRGDIPLTVTAPTAHAPAAPLPTAPAATATAPAATAPAATAPTTTAPTTTPPAATAP